ncbi:Tissue alpha-L-fucosidase, partial [Acropora cervicornis]
SFTACEARKYEPTWESLDSRPIPYWYDEAKFGIFMHWGLYSVPSFGSEWFWYYWQGKKVPKFVDFMKKNYPPGFSYADFAPMFTAEFFDPDEFAQLVQNSGASYYVLTTKHHDGWTNWKSNVSWNYNAVDSGPHMDLQISNPQIYDLVNKYKPDVLWADGDWEASSDYWMSKDFLAWLYNDSPVKDTIIVNDRWGNDSRRHHGGRFCKRRSGKMPQQLTNVPGDTEEMPTLETSAPLLNFCGGNLLLNMGPTKEGTIVPAFQERLLQMGEWLKINGEAIYSTSPWRAQNDSLTPNFPINNTIVLGEPIPSDKTMVTMLGVKDVFKWSPSSYNGGIKIYIPPYLHLPSQYGWVFKLENVR